MPPSKNEFDFNAERCWRLCCLCAVRVFNTQPSPTYALNAAKFLLEIATQESSLRWERQRSPSYTGRVGGFSKWQMESGWIISAMIALADNSPLAQRVTDFVFADPHCPPDYILNMNLDTLLIALRMNDNDALGVALCRVGILKWPEYIPETMEARSRLWKGRYNTAKGKGTIAQYEENALRYCFPVYLSYTSLMADGRAV